MNALLRDELTHELPCRDTRLYEVAPDWERPVSGERRRGYMLLTTARTDTKLDHFWNELSAGGAQGPCGWLKDRFGVSWQIVPQGIVQWMTSRDAAASDRCFQAMLDMEKLDIAKLEAAFKAA